MSTRKAKLDRVLQSKGVEVEPEELVEPEIEAQDEPEIQGRSRRVAAMRERLGRYGNRVLGSAKRFFVTIWHMLLNIGTAIAGSIVLLPFVILVRGLDVLLSTVFSLAKSAVFSLFRAIFDLLCIPVRAVNEVFHRFNKQVLYPAIKQIREDDTSAVIAFVALLSVVGAVIFIVTRFGH